MGRLFKQGQIYEQSAAREQMREAVAGAKTIVPNKAQDYAS
jgi:uncharacterized protein YktA (UPF0223 family)